MNSEVAGCDRIAWELAVLALGNVRWEHTPEAAVLGDAANELKCSQASSYLAAVCLKIFTGFYRTFNRVRGFFKYSGFSIFSPV